MTTKRGDEHMLPAHFTLYKEHHTYTLFRLELTPSLPALFLRPRKFSPPYPTFFFLHYYRGSKENLLPLAQEFAKNGFAALAIDMEYHGERRKEGRDLLSTDLKDDLLAFRRTLDSALLSLEFLETWEEIDKGAIYFLGVSLGAILGVTVCREYRRFQKAIFVVGGGNLETLIAESMLDSIVEIRYDLRRRGIPIREATQDFHDFEPLFSIRNLSSTPLLFLNATHDEIVPQGCTFDLYEAAPSPKKLSWFPAGHGLLFAPTFRISRRIVEFALEKNV
jgi:dienelactone hydrolase